MRIVVDPFGVGLSVAAFLLSGRLRIMGDDGQPFAIGGDGITANVNGQRLVLIFLLVVFLIVRSLFVGIFLVRVWRRDEVLCLRLIDERKDFQIVRLSLSAAHVQAEKLRVLAAMSEEEDGFAVRRPLHAALATLVRRRREGELAKSISSA